MRKLMKSMQLIEIDAFKGFFARRLIKISRSPFSSSKDGEIAFGGFHFIAIEYDALTTTRMDAFTQN
jgi:hypothetical protein